MKLALSNIFSVLEKSTLAYAPSTWMTVSGGMTSDLLDEAVPPQGAPLQDGDDFVTATADEPKISTSELEKKLKTFLK